MKMLPYLLSVCIACTALPGWAQRTDSSKSNKPLLVFQTGFEGTSRVIRDVNHALENVNAHYSVDDIIGADTKLTGKNDWLKDMDNNPDAGTFMLEYTGGDSTRRTASIIAEPGNPDNHVLAFILKDSWEASERQVKARIQADIYGIKKGYREFYQSELVFIPATFNALRKYPGKISWLTISEVWNNEWWVANEKYGFRVTLGIGKPTAAKGDLVFILNAEDAGQKEVWNANDHPVKVPIGKWFTMDYYFKEGDVRSGRFYLAITPDGGQKNVVFDVEYIKQFNRVAGFRQMNKHDDQ
ncbi:hypothetical protein [Mucilaginibacter flavidus]|uniref:hypothetical protein n=1 Tax=Mucilaginibacter flavidus TaxID=2949309 RepID=UPI002093F38F|nr:hypothetical protein [Mucilaginibacter flavidus]MCO5948005.1 hypothetical protein [Mucilaginibacter flavidus]